MIRLGLIGVGGYGGKHVNGFLALQAEGLVRIAAVADKSPATLDAVCALPELKTARRFASYEELLAGPGLDAVVITAPISLHREITLAALERGLFIMLEKPPVPVPSQLDELIAADVEGRVMVAFQHIYSGLSQRLKRDLVAGEIGDLVSISAHGVWPRHTSYYNRSAWAGQLAWNGLPVLDGPCTNAFAHFINLGAWFAGGEMNAFVPPSVVTGEAYRARTGLRAYDTGCLTGSFENGVRFFMGFSHTSFQALPVTVRIRGTRGTIDLLDDCRLLRKGSELIEGDEGTQQIRRTFLAFAAGDVSQNKTPLHATRPYVLATNMMLLSSGGVHQIPGDFVRAVDPDTEHGFFEVDGIGEFLSQGAEHLAPLCETRAPWAKKTRPIKAADFSEIELLQELNIAPVVSDIPR